MRVRKLLIAALVGALLLGGAAAVGASTIAETPEESNDNATTPDEDEIVDNTTHDIDVDEDDVGERDRPHQAGGPDDRSGTHDGQHGEDRPGAEDRPDAEDRPGTVGPSDGLPAQVPDHVSEIHQTIESFLNGEIDNLGEAISGIFSDADGEDVDEEVNDSDENDE